MVTPRISGTGGTQTTGSLLQQQELKGQHRQRRQQRQQARESLLADLTGVALQTGLGIGGLAQRKAEEIGRGTRQTGQQTFQAAESKLERQAAQKRAETTASGRAGEFSSVNRALAEDNVRDASEMLALDIMTPERFEEVKQNPSSVHQDIQGFRSMRLARQSQLERKAPVEDLIPITPRDISELTPEQIARLVAVIQRESGPNQFRGRIDTFRQGLERQGSVPEFIDTPELLFPDEDIPAAEMRNFELEPFGGMRFLGAASARFDAIRRQRIQEAKRRAIGQLIDPSGDLTEEEIEFLLEINPQIRGQ